MGKYLENKELDSVLESYFEEGVTSYPKYKLDKFEIQIKNYNSEYDDIYKKTYELVKKNLDKIKKQSAKFMYNNLSIDKDFKFTEKEIYNKIFIQHAPYMEYFPNLNNPVCQIDICYDTKPYLDSNHVFSIYCAYYPESNKFTYNDYAYDG